MTQLRVTIDGRETTVAPGTTILEAARSLGIEVPTLCHVPGYEASSSCFLCAVQIQGRPTLSPSCGMPVQDGMVVETSTDDIRASRKMALELLLSDHAGDCIAPCRASCPAGLDIPGFVYHVAKGRRRRTMAVISETLFFPGALGRICPRLCEQRCRRHTYDESLSIAKLHRFAADKDLADGDPYLPRRARSTGKRVATIGAGPAGLAAAYHVLARGHDCTLFDAQPQPGGMLRYGIPEYRLPKSSLDAEIDIVRRLGGEFRMGQRWGTDFTLRELRQEFDAVFIGIGAQGAQRLGCEGDELALSGIEFLERVAKGERPRIGDRVVVVGGGNTAMDVSRSALRLGAREVRVVYRRSRNEMPCLLDEVEEAEREGVTLSLLSQPTRLRRSERGTLVLECVQMQLGEPDDSGRRRPVPIPGSEHELEATAVVAAIGQTVDLQLAKREGLEVTRWGIRVDERTLETSLDGVFAGGDGVAGADLAVRAVAAGRVAAVSIDQRLRGRPVVGEARPMHILLQGPNDHEMAAIFREIDKGGRTPAHEIDIEGRRSTFDEIDSGLLDDEAVHESRRCLSCGCRKASTCGLRQYGTEYGVDPYRFRGERRRFSQDLSHPDVIYEPGKCILCDACVRVAAREGEELGLSSIGRGFQVTVGVPFDRPLSEGLKRVATLCAKVCPTGALALASERACDVCTFRDEPAQRFLPSSDVGVLPRE